MATRKSYTYATTGLVLGTLIAFLMHDVLGLPGGARFFLWLLIVASVSTAVGYFIGMLEPRAQQPVKKATDPSGEKQISTTMRFFAIADKSSTELKPVRVRFPKPTRTPPDMELELLIDSYEDTSRCNVIEGVLQKLPLSDLIERVETEANNRVPKNAKNAELRVVSFRSEGPLGSEGHSSAGWTFELVDGALGIGASVTSTQSGMSLRYTTAVTHMQPSSRELPALQQCHASVMEEFPELADQPLYVRAELPDELLFFPATLEFILDVNPSSGRVRNAGNVRDIVHRWATEGTRKERFALEDIFAWSRGEEPGGEDFRAALQTDGFSDGLRTFRLDVMNRVGRALFANYGPEVVRTLSNRAMDPSDGNDPRLEIELLAHVPGGLAVAAVHDLASTAPEDAGRQEAEKLFSEYRRGVRDLTVDPVARLGFERSRELMGKERFRVVPLQSSFSLEEDLIEPLQGDIGLRALRTRYLSGDSQLPLAVHLRPDRGDTEALVISSPLPVPCHMLHIVGDAADTFAERTEKAGLTYGENRLFQDLISSVPTRVHRAALYLAARRLASPEGAEPLIQAYQRGRADRNLRRAIMFALAYTPGDLARRFILARAEDEDHDDAATAREALRCRAEVGLDAARTASVEAVPEDEESPETVAGDEADQAAAAKA